MSLRLLQAVLSSNHTKSSTRFAQVLLAYHACPSCDRVYCSVARLALEMNIDPRNAKTLLKKLRDEKYIEPTGEMTPEGIIVYQLRGVMHSSPNKQCFDRQENDKGYTRARTKCGRDDCQTPACPHTQQCAYHACCEVCARER